MYDDDEMINELWRRAVPYLLFGCGMRSWQGAARNLSLRFTDTAVVTL